MIDLPLLTPSSLARTGVDRDHLNRGTDGDLSEVWQLPAVGIVAHRGYLLVARGGLVRLRHEDIPQRGTEIYLGTDPHGTHFIGCSLNDDERAALDQRLAADKARDASDFLSEPADGIHTGEPTWLNLRNIALELSDVDVALATALVSVGNWHQTHQFSPRNGQPTVTRAGGWVRTDPSTGSEHFPRTDPAVIMAIVHTDEQGTERLLLGNNALWNDTMYSLLAGFVEPGETLESAVIREVYEETGVNVHSPRYLGSQPWPFPCSLMLGFTAIAEDRVTQVDTHEISAVRWFTREELRAAVASGSIQVPGQVSIAGQIVSSWLDAA